MANLTAQLTGGTISVIDATGSVIRVQSPIASTVLSASTVFYDAYLLVAAGGGSAISLPAATVFFVYIRSLAGQNGAANGNITVTPTPSGGAANNAGVLLPSGIFMYLNTAESAGGYTALNLTASIASTPVEILIAA